MEQKAKIKPKYPYHQNAIKSLGSGHHAIADKIGHGCRHYQVRDWMRRGFIPPEWIAHVADVHPTETIESLVRAIAFSKNPVTPEQTSDQSATPPLEDRTGLSDVVHAPA